MRGKLAESDKARKAAEKEIKELRAAAAGDSSDLTPDADDQIKQTQPNAELKKKLAELGDEESGCKKWLGKPAYDNAMADRLAAIQAEMADIRNRMQLAKEPSVRHPD